MQSAVSARATTSVWSCCVLIGRAPKSRSTTGAWPLEIAMRSGVTPWGEVLSTVAPPLRSLSTTHTWPSCAATYSGVKPPSVLGLSTSAPAATSFSATSAWPSMDAMSSAENPVASSLAFAPRLSSVSTARTWPCFEAAQMGDTPSLLGLCTLAPLSIKVSMTSQCP